MKDTWRNMVCIVAALWLCISPLALHFKLDSVVSGDTDIVGIFIAALSIIALASHHAWEQWTKIILGAWLLASPWVLGFGQHIVATRDITIVGAGVVILSLWSLVNRLGSSRISARPPSLPPSASELLIHTMNLQGKNPDAGHPR